MQIFLEDRVDVKYAFLKILEVAKHFLCHLY